MTRKWVPSEYVDEITPPPRETPSDWIVDGKALAGFDETDPPKPLTEGQIVEFSWSADLGSCTITLREDGSYTTDAPVPDAPEGGTFNVYDGCDADTLAFDMPSFIEALREEGPGSYDAAFFSWSTRNHPFTFRNGRFVAEQGEG